MVPQLSTSSIINAFSSLTTSQDEGGTSDHDHVTSAITFKDWSLAETTINPRLATTEHQLSSTEEKAFQAVHTILTVAALFANCLSLFVVYGVVPQLTCPLRLLTSLAFAHMLAPWAVMTIYFSRSSCQDEIHTSVLLTSHNAGAMTLFVLALSHVIACFRPFHFTNMVSTRRIWASVAIAWILSVLLAHVHFLVSLSRDGSGEWSDLTKGQYCDRVAGHTWIAIGISSIVAVLVLLIGMVIYWRILVSLQPVQAFIVEHRNNDKTYGVVTGIILLVLYGLSWVPYLIVRGIASWSGTDNRATLVVTGVCQTIILFCCFLEPIIEGWRMDQVKSGYITLARRIRTRVSDAWTRCQRSLRRGSDNEMPTTPLNQIDFISY